MEVKEVTFRANTEEGVLECYLDEEGLMCEFYLLDFPSERGYELKREYQKYYFNLHEINAKTIKELFDKVRDITEHWNITDGITSAMFRNYDDFVESVWFTLMKFKKKLRKKLKSRCSQELKENH